MSNSVCYIYMFGKDVDIMRMLRSENQNRGFDEKLTVLWWFSIAAHFVQVLVLNYTKNGRLGGQYLHVWQEGRYHAYVEIWVPESWIW